MHNLWICSLFSNLLLSGMWNNWTFVHLFSIAGSFSGTSDSFAFQIEFANWWNGCRMFAKHSRISDCCFGCNGSRASRNSYQSNLHCKWVYIPKWFNTTKRFMCVAFEKPNIGINIHSKPKCIYVKFRKKTCQIRFQGELNSHPCDPLYIVADDAKSKCDTLNRLYGALFH